MKKVLLSVLVISVVAGLGYLGTQAYFSDTEEVLGNTSSGFSPYPPGEPIVPEVPEVIESSGSMPDV